ncbi:MAG: hypothetical protein P4L51_05845, partial [Puia sp.]|nr:hypothetical protein [Puia sp.]
MRNILLALPALLLVSVCAYGQTGQPSVVDQAIKLPTKFFSRVNKTTADLDKELTVQTQQYLARLAKQDAKLHKKLAAKDSTAAASLYGPGATDYNALAARLQNAGSKLTKTPGTYIPYLDSLQTSLKFLQQNKQLLANGAAYQAQITSSLAQVNQLQAKIQVTSQINQQIAARQARIKAVLSQATNLSGVQHLYQGYSKQAYYYSAQLKQYRSDLSDPDKIAKRALGVLNQLPSFQQFMKSNSQLAGLFSLPSASGSGTATAIAGLQTRTGIQSLLQSQVAAGGPNAAGMVQQNIQAAKTALTNWKNKVTQAGGSGSDQAIPDFHPNPEHTRKFLQRLVFGASLQTARSTYAFPTTTNISLSLGYKLDDRNTIGVSAGYLIGWGQDIKHIRVSSNGASLQSWLEMKIKGSIYGMGAYGYNFQPVAPSLQIPGIS